MHFDSRLEIDELMFGTIMHVKWLMEVFCLIAILFFSLDTSTLFLSAPPPIACKTSFKNTKHVPMSYCGLFLSKALSFMIIGTTLHSCGPPPIIHTISSLKTSHAAPCLMR